MATYYRTGVETYSIIGTADEKDSLEGRIPDGSTYFAVDENMFYTFYDGQWYETLPEAARLYHDDVGTDTKPIKLVGGVATVVANELAEDAKVVHKTGAETVAGNKTFTSSSIWQMGTPAMYLKSNTQSDGHGRRATLMVSDVYGGNETMLGEERWGVSSGGYTYRSLVLNNPDRSSEQYVQIRSYPSSFQIYAPTYYPVDSSDNPRPLAADMLVTSGNIAVDPRIVHTTGTETVAGDKTFSGTLTVNDLKRGHFSVAISPGIWAKVYEFTPYRWGSGMIASIYNDFALRNYVATKLVVAVGNQPTYNLQGYLVGIDSATMVGKVARRASDGVLEVWIKNSQASGNIGLSCEFDHLRNVVPTPVGVTGDEPTVGDTYSEVLEMTNEE